MSKSFRGSVVFAGLVVVLGLSQVAFAGGIVQTKDQATSNPESSKTASQTKSKKRKKRKAVSISYISVFGNLSPQTVSEPLTINS
jgi:hypothetical protein